MLKKIFFIFLMFFILVSSTWAGIYRGKLTTNFARGNPDDFTFNFTELQNDLGLNIELLPLVKRYTSRYSSYISKVAVCLLIKNPDFSIKFKNFQVLRINHYTDRSGNITSSQNIKSLDYTWQYHSFVPYITDFLSYTEVFYERNKELIKSKANNLIIFKPGADGKVINLDDSNYPSYAHDLPPTNYDIYFMIEDPTTPNNIQPESNLAYIETEEGINLKINQEEVPIFENRDTEDFNYSFIKCSDKPEVLANGNIKCFANQIRKIKAKKIRTGNNPEKAKDKIVKNRMIKLIEAVSGFRTDRVYIIYNPFLNEIVESSQNLYLE